MKSIKWAAITGGLALAAFQIMASPVQAQTFATATIKGTPQAAYTITYTIDTKNHKKLSTPPPFIDVQFSINGGPFSDYLNSKSNSSFTVAPNGNTCSFTSFFQFSTRTTSAKLKFNSTDTNLTLKKVSEQPSGMNLPAIRLNAASPGRYQVTLVVSDIYAGPPIPSPVPAFTFTARGAGVSEANAPVQAAPTSDSRKLQLTFDLTTKKAGQIEIIVQSPFKYLTLVSDGSFNTNPFGKAVNLGQHNNF